MLEVPPVHAASSSLTCIDRPKTSVNAVCFSFIVSPWILETRVESSQVEKSSLMFFLERSWWRVCIEVFLFFGNVETKKKIKPTLQIRSVQVTKAPARAPHGRRRGFQKSWMKFRFLPRLLARSNELVSDLSIVAVPLFYPSPVRNITTGEIQIRPSTAKPPSSRLCGVPFSWRCSAEQMSLSRGCIPQGLHPVA